MATIVKTYRIKLTHIKTKEHGKMDIKEKINEVVEKITKDKTLQEKFQKEPIKAVESILGVDLPDDVIMKIVEGVKGKISVDKISDALGSLKKLF